MKRGIIFDWGRVLGRFDHMIFCRGAAEYSSHTPEYIYKRVIQGEVCHWYERGKVSSEEFFQHAREIIQPRQGFTRVVFERLWMDIVLGDTPYIEFLLENLSSDIAPPVILSNTSELHWKKISSLPLVRRFFPSDEQLVLSFRMGFVKPDASMFLEAIKRTGCTKEGLVYIDDIENYVNAFKKQTGGRGVVFNCEKDDINYLYGELRKFGITT